ncbi:MAG: VOC family protein [Acidimicrobiales bacterium]
MASLVVFSVDVTRCAAFYEKVLGLRAQPEVSGDIRLFGDGEEVLVHSVPKEVAMNIVISIPPSPRENSALKPAFDVASLEVALDQVRSTGGVVTNRTFTLDGLARHDVLDPDGNVIQLRCRVP